MSMRLKPALRWTIRNYGKGAAAFMAVLALLALLFGILGIVLDAQGGYNNFSSPSYTGGIFLLVMTLVISREDLRMLLQNGVSRRTSFLAEQLTMVLYAFGIAGAMTLLTAAVQAGGLLKTFDLCQILYWPESLDSMTLGQQFTGWLFGSCLMLLVGMAGQCCSLLFWRLNRLWTVVAAVSIPLLLIAIPVGLFRLCTVSPAALRALQACAGFLGASPWNAMAAALAGSLLLTAVSWLLLRRANIQAPK